ncbi:MAG TPA: hypothetical protein VGP50_00530 [Stellaceae bacterium]|nr:hypothetical protein [Stellaceae bacterium]
MSAKLSIGAAVSVWSLSLLYAGPAAADFKVITPDANSGELELETVGDAGFDPNRNKSGEQSYTSELEYGVTSWWQTELEVEFNRAAGAGQDIFFNQVTSENVFQFTERGEYWLDAGFFAEYGQSTLRNAPSGTTFGPILRKDFWGTSTTVDLFLEKDLGDHAAGRPVFSFAAETRLDSLVMQFGRHVAVEPGFQIYGTPGAIGHFARWGQQDERAGPQLFGKIFNIGPGTLEWNGGVLFGLSPAVPAVTPRWQIEYEIHY